MITCIAIDDEPKALNVIQSHATQIEYLELKQVFSDPFEALVYLKNNPIDFVFLDINMPDVDGFSVLNQLPDKTLVIFTTAHSEYAIQSYEVEAIDYLLKPFDFVRFQSAVTKIKNKLSADTLVAKNNEFFFVNTGGTKQKILFSDVYFLKSDANYVHYFTKSGKYMVRASIKELLTSLPENDFIQTHRSYIVSLKWVEKIDAQQVLVANKLVPMSSTFKAKLLDQISLRSI